MFIDLTVHSRGKYAIFATVTGSYGEQAYVQVGRARIDPEHAASHAYDLAQGTKYTNVTLKNVDTGRVYYFEKEEKPRLAEAVQNLTATAVTSQFVKRVRKSYRALEMA